MEKYHENQRDAAKRYREFERTRREVLERMAECARQRGEPVIIRVIPFRNNDVPEYLKRLRRFEKRSRKVVIEVGQFLYNN